MRTVFAFQQQSAAGHPFRSRPEQSPAGSGRERSRARESSLQQEPDQLSRVQHKLANRQEASTHQQSDWAEV
jgi:hypothetical protein